MSSFAEDAYNDGEREKRVRLDYDAASSAEQKGIEAFESLVSQNCKGSAHGEFCS